MDQQADSRATDYGTAHDAGPEPTSNPWRHALVFGLAIAGSGALMGFAAGLACGWLVWH